MPSIIRSILAIVAGFLLIGALAFGTGAGLHAAGLFPAPGEPLTTGQVLLERAAATRAGDLPSCSSACRHAANPGRA